MKKLLPILLLLVACERNYTGIPEEEFEKILDNCDTSAVQREILSDEQLQILGLHDQSCKLEYKQYNNGFNVPKNEPTTAVNDINSSIYILASSIHG